MAERSPFSKFVEKNTTNYKEIQEFEKDLPVLSTGILGLDLLLGAEDPILHNGGLRARDIVEIFGKDGCGKTAISFAMMQETQRRYPDKKIACLFYEMPDFHRMEKSGVNVDDLIVLNKPGEPGERGLQKMVEIAKYEEIALCIIDSIAAIPVTADAEKEIGDSQAVAGRAKIVNDFTARFVAETCIAPCLALNHYKEPINTGFKLGGGGGESPLSPNTPGGNTMNFLSKARVMINSTPDYSDETHSMNKNKKVTGLKMKAKACRNKYAPPLRVVEIKYDFDSFLFNNAEQTLRYASWFSYKDGADWKSKIDPPVYQSGSWVYFNGEKYQGFENACKVLESDRELMIKIQNQIIPYGKQFFNDVKVDEDELDR